MTSTQVPEIGRTEAQELCEQAGVPDWFAGEGRHLHTAFYRTDSGDLLVRGYGTPESLFETAPRQLFSDAYGRAKIVAVHRNPQFQLPPRPGDEHEPEEEEEPAWRPAVVRISGLEGTFRGEVGKVFSYGGGTEEAVRFTAEVAEEIASAFERASDEQLDRVSSEDALADHWDSEKYGHFRPRAFFVNGTFDVVTGDREGATIDPDEDGMYRLDFDGLYWTEVNEPQP